MCIILFNVTTSKKLDRRRTLIKKGNTFTIFTIKIYSSGNIFLKILILMSSQSRHSNESNAKRIAQF